MPEAEHAGEELAVVTYSDVGKITSLNSHGVLLLGFRESELIDLDVMTLICPDVFEDSGEDAARQTFGLESRGGASSPTTLGGSGNRSPAALDSPRSPRSSSRPTQSVQQLHTYLRRKTKPSFAAQLHVHKFRVPIPKAARVAKGPKHLTTFACTFSHADGEEMMTSLLLGERVGSPEEESPLREIGDGDCDSDDAFGDDPALADLTPQAREKAVRRLRKKARKQKKKKKKKKKAVTLPDGHHHHHHHHAKALFIDMEELEFVHDEHRGDHEMTEDTDGGGEEGHLEWHETARWKHGLEEQVIIDEDDREHFAQGRVSSIPFHAIVLLRMALLHGEVALDLDIRQQFGDHEPEDRGGAFANAIFKSVLDRMQRQNVIDEDAHDKALDTLMRHHHHKVRTASKKNSERAKRAAKTRSARRAAAAATSTPSTGESGGGSSNVPVTDTKAVGLKARRNSLRDVLAKSRERLRGKSTDLDDESAVVATGIAMVSSVSGSGTRLSKRSSSATLFTSRASTPEKTKTKEAGGEEGVSEKKRMTASVAASSAEKLAKAFCVGGDAEASGESDDDADNADGEKNDDVTRTTKKRSPEISFIHVEHSEEFSSSASSSSDSEEGDQEEEMDVLIAAVDFVQNPVVAFVRLMRPLAIDLEHADVHIDGAESEDEDFVRRRKKRLVRFIFVVFGPKKDANDCHNMGHAMAALMNTHTFRREVESVEHKLGMIRAIDTFLDHSTVIPGADDFDILKRERRAALEEVKAARESRRLRGKERAEREKSVKGVVRKAISSKISDKVRRLLSGGARDEDGDDGVAGGNVTAAGTLAQLEGEDNGAEKEPEYSESDDDIDIDAAMDFTSALAMTRPTHQTYGMSGHHMKERVAMRTAARDRFAAMYYKKDGEEDDRTLWFDPDSTTADPVAPGLGLEVRRAVLDDNGDFTNANAVVKALGKHDGQFSIRLLRKMKHVEDEKDEGKFGEWVKRMKVAASTVEVKGCNCRKKGSQNGITLPCLDDEAEVCTLLDLMPFLLECVKIGMMLALCIFLVVVLCAWDVHPHDAGHAFHTSHLSGYHMEVDGGLHVVGEGKGVELPEPAYQHVLHGVYRAVIDARIIVGACASTLYNYELQWKLFVTDGISNITGQRYGHAVAEFGTRILALSAHEAETYENYDSLDWDPNAKYGSDLAWAAITPDHTTGPEMYLEFSVHNVSSASTSSSAHRRRLQGSGAASAGVALHGCGGVGGVGLMVQTLGMPALARSRIAIGLVILVGVYAVMLLEIVHRAVCGLVGALLVLGLLGLIGTPPTFNTVIDWMDEGTLGLLFGMMIIVAMLSTTGLFEWLAAKALKMSKGNIFVLMSFLTFATAFLSAFLDNVTTMLLIAPVTIKICVALGIDPVALLIAEAMFANLGGAATMIGDPPNIIIGLALKEHLGFSDFIVNVCPVVLISYIPAMVLTKLMFWKEFPFSQPLDDDGVPRVFGSDFYTKLETKFTIRNYPLLAKAGSVTVCVILLLFLHPVHHKDSHWIAFLGAVAILLLAKPHEFHHLLDMVEWDTLLFFSGLFVLIEGLSELGLLRYIGGMMADTIAGIDDSSRLAVALVMLIWITGVASAILDNIPFTATMVPIIIQLAENEELNLDIRPLAWALSLGACLGGLGTLVGSSCTLVTAGIAEAQGYDFGFFTYTIRGAPFAVLCLIIATVYILFIFVVLGLNP